MGWGGTRVRSPSEASSLPFFFYVSEYLIHVTENVKDVSSKKSLVLTEFAT